MIKSYKGYAYFDNHPEIVKIFEDLEAFHDFCRFELLPFNEADLYNGRSYIWRAFSDRNGRRYPAKKRQFEKKPYRAQ